MLMSTGRNLLKNTLALSVPNFLNPVISFVLVLVISRYMGVRGLGQYSLVLSYMAVFVILAPLGLSTLIVREVAKGPDDAHAVLINAGLFATISSLVAMVGMNALVWAMDYEREIFLASLIISLSLVTSTWASYEEAILRAVERSEFIAVTYVVENVIRVSICTFLVLTEHGIVSLFCAILGTRFFAFCLMSFFYIRAVGKPRWEFRPEIWRLMTQQAPTFASIALFSTIHLSIDQIILSKLRSVDSVGIYSAADRLLDICKTFPMAFAAALLPLFAREFVQGLPNLRQLVVTATRYLFLGTLPVVVGTVVLGDQIITLIYGQRFDAAIPVLRLHIVSLVPFSLVYILAYVLIATDNQRIDLSINAVAVGVNIALCFLFIPRLAEMGAVLATLVTIVMFNQLQYWYIKHYLFSLPFLKMMAKALLAAGGMAIITYSLRGLNLFANVAVSAGAYFLLVFLLKAFSPEEIGFLKGLLRTRRNQGGT
jgi:O-antigen/teichoic acid export membrane protein